MQLQPKNSVVWIVGASSGIGKALALQYSAMDCELILSSRNTDELQKVKNECKQPERCHIIALDLNDEISIENACQLVLDEFPRIDYLFLNGGISQRSLIRETPLEIDKKMMQIDYFGGIQITKRILPLMLKNKFGHITVTSSIVGVFGFPQRSAYSAAKHAIHGFYETLRAEEQNNGIRVTVVCPGRILTNISLHALTKDGKEHGIMDHAQAHGLTAEFCAKKIVRAVSKNRKEIFICQKDILMVYFRRHIPFLYYKLVGKVKPN